jgi:hypothetical protein
MKQTMKNITTKNVAAFAMLPPCCMLTSWFEAAERQACR